MNNKIMSTCPKCGHEYEIDLNEKIADILEKGKVQVETKLRENLDKEYKDKMLERIEEERELGKRQVIEELNNERIIKEKEKEIEHQNEIKELKLHIEKLTEKIEEASKQTDQTPICIKGEIGENNLEEILHSLYPNDKIEKIPKGRGGADYIQTIIEGNRECGKILYENKNTKDFDKKWIPKLKEDAIDIKSDFNVIVTKIMPEGNENPHNIDGIWICSPLNIDGVVRILRDSVIRLDIAYNSQSNRAGKGEELLNYINSNEYIGRAELILQKLNNRRTKQEKKKIEFEKFWKDEIKETTDLISDINSIFFEIDEIKKKGINENEVLIVKNP